MSEARGGREKYVRCILACRSVAAEPRAGNASRHTGHIPEGTVESQKTYFGAFSFLRPDLAAVFASAQGYTGHSRTQIIPFFAGRMTLLRDGRPG